MGEGNAPAAVVLRRVLKSFGTGAPAVDTINLDIAPGELVTLLGPSGCGKTTTLRMIAGLEEPTAGSITIGDEDVTHLPAEKRDVTMVFQSYALFPHMNVFENVAYGLKVARRPRPEIAARVAEALDLVGLGAYADRSVDALSGGQQQRVALARALVMKPRVILFDEPLSNLDAKLRLRVRAEIRALQRRLGLTAVYVTHDQEEALAISDRVVVMKSGRIEQIGTPRDLYTRPATRFVADFIGSANILPGTWDGAQVFLDGIGFAHAQEDLAPGPVSVVLRPESLRPGPSGLPATVAAISFLGASTQVDLETAAGPVTALLPDAAAAGLETGQQTRLDIAGGGMHLLAGGEDAPQAAPT
ncbi:ABC transporter ATP-binding protein [Tabrizicola sp. DMG-N-6]|uniref:ABC transporter ATP-binding protein n=2 Tax=Szabonella alba TaxID=2804194 RepID=A0A8K0V7L0_9RHOB|nr:ABC transporter ATP-binding protein [Szabonella alba]